MRLRAKCLKTGTRNFDERTTRSCYTFPFHSALSMYVRLIRAVLAAGILTVFCGAIYGTVQQNYRQTANDPQIQMAEDSAAKLEAGSSVASVIPSEKVDIARNLAPFVILYDDTGKPVASSGLLDGIIPQIPTGIFDAVRLNGEDRVTWQPQESVRIALVVMKVQGAQSGFVAAGRSLREVEVREDQLTKMIAATWFISILLVLGIAVF